jgi:hypothetical protein
LGSRDHRGLVFHHRGTEGTEKTMRMDVAERIAFPPLSVPSVPLW